jgi:integrase
LSANRTVRATGHLQIKGKRGGRAWYALVRDADGRHQRMLGPAWVKDSGKRTARGAVKWVARDGTKPQGYLTPTDAEDLLRQILAEAPRQTTPPRKVPARITTLREACDDWLRWAQHDREVKRSTLGDYRSACERLCRDLGATAPITTLTARRLQEWVDRLPAERRAAAPEAKRRRAAGAKLRRLPDGYYVQLTPASSRTKRKYLVVLNGVMTRAVKRGVLDTNPVPLIDRPGRLHTRRTLTTAQFLRPAEIHALLRSAAEVEPQDAVMFMVAAFCGLRLGELLDLRWGAINFKGASILVESGYVRNARDTPKSHAARSVPMAPEVAKALREHAKRVPMRSDSGLVFVGDGARHVGAKRLRQRYYDALDRAGIKRLRIHDLRHTFGTVCAAKGIPLTTIKEWMGHADLATTEIYTTFYPQVSDAAKISAAFAEDPDPSQTKDAA